MVHHLHLHSNLRLKKERYAMLFIAEKNIWRLETEEALKAFEFNIIDLQMRIIKAYTGKKNDSPRSHSQFVFYLGLTTQAATWIKFHKNYLIHPMFLGHKGCRYEANGV